MDSESEEIEKENDVIEIIPMDKKYYSGARKYFGYLKINNKNFSKEKIYCTECNKNGLKKS